MQKAVIVETKKEFQRPDGSTLRFDRNACVLVNAKGMPIGSRVLGFVTHELRARNLMKARVLRYRCVNACDRCCLLIPWADPGTCHNFAWLCESRGVSWVQVLSLSARVI